MMKHLVSLAVCVVAGMAQPASLSVQSDRAGLRVFLDNEPIGMTPIKNHLVDPGEHWASFFPVDSSESRYDDVAGGDLGSKLDALWYLARVNKGTVRISVSPGETRSVFLSMRDVERAPCQAKWLVAGAIGAPLVVGIAVGIVIGLLAGGK